jgi:tetratricopeptide (TPR) repeat protein
LAKSGNLNLALLDIAKKINTDPEDDQALHIRAILALKNKDYYAATKNLAVAIERAQHKENKKLAEENVAYHRIFLAKILNIQHQYQAAIDETDLALKTTKDADAYFQRGIAFSQQNKFVLALSDFKSAFKLRQKPIFQYEIAHAHYRLEKFDEADSILTAMVLENTNLSEVYFLRGKIAIFQNKFEAAVTDMNKTLDFAPDQVFALYFRAFAFEKLGKNAEKCADIQKIKEIANAEIMADDNFILMAKKCK